MCVCGCVCVCVMGMYGTVVFCSAMLTFGDELTTSQETARKGDNWIMPNNILDSTYIINYGTDIKIVKITYELFSSGRNTQMALVSFNS